MTNNSWNEYQEQLCIKWWKDSVSYGWKHIESAKYYEARDKYLSLPTVIVKTITGTAVFAVIFNASQCDGNLILFIILATVTVIDAILFAVDKSLKYATLAEKHKNSADLFKGFANNIESEMVFKREERLDGKIFIKQSQKRYSELLQICPNIPDKIEKKFKDKEQTDEIQKILEIVIVPNNPHLENVEPTAELSDSQTDLQKELAQEMEVMKNSQSNVFNKATLDRLTTYF